MKIGMNLYLWLTRLEPAHFPLLAELRAAGFDGVEIPCGDYSDAELYAIRRVLADEGLACTVATLLREAENPIAEDPAIRQAALHKIHRDIEMAGAIGAEALVGPIHSAHKCFTGRGPNAREFTHCVDFLQRVGERAASAGLYLGVEPLNRFECYFLNTAEQDRRLVEAVASDHVKVLYDTHHANIEEADVYSAISTLGSHLGHFHVSESHRGTPGTGTVDWADSFRALRDMDYQGWVVIEAFGKDVPGIPEAVNIWRNCFSDEREVYMRGIDMIRRGLVDE